MKRPKATKKPTINFSASRAATLFKQGKSVSQIAQAMGYPPGQGNNRTRNALMKAGLYQKQSAAPVQPRARAARTLRVPRAASPAPARTTVDVPNDIETALKVGLQTAVVNADNLKLDNNGRSIFARRLMGMIAANFGIQEFQVRKPVLVFDEAAARAGMFKVANA